MLRQTDRSQLGEKMLDRLDLGVSLSSLIHGQSPGLQSDITTSVSSQPGDMHARSFSTGSEGISLSSPTRAVTQGRTRDSLVRYSQQSKSEPLLHLSEETSDQSVVASSHSTNVSITSLWSSPCPAPRQTRVSMLKLQPALTFHFPALSRANLAEHCPTSPWVETTSQGLSSGSNLFLVSPVQDDRRLSGEHDSSLPREAAQHQLRFHRRAVEPLHPAIRASLRGASSASTLTRQSFASHHATGHSTSFVNSQFFPRTSITFLLG